jgi:hypothetical protein
MGVRSATTTRIHRFPLERGFPQVLEVDDAMFDSFLMLTR